MKSIIYTAVIWSTFFIGIVFLCGGYESWLIWLLTIVFGGSSYLIVTKNGGEEAFIKYARVNELEALWSKWFGIDFNEV